ncbi:MAG: CoA ester lyase [Deferribacteraceae bacterium]|jgi:citrate lyase subunit beta/citryl-CoA lyase|nr:CoA ester lyase [Deferribacteraceae bacterium]
MLRSLLFLPGNNPNLIMNGGILGADGIIFDLEDAVAPDEKDGARILVRNAMKALDYGSVNIIVRINSIDDNGYWKADLDEVIPLKPYMIMPTKVSDAGYIKQISAYIDEVEKRNNMKVGSTKLIPLLETAIGIENAYNIATSDARIEAMFIGAEDLTADLQCERTKAGNEIFYARARIVSAARAAGVEVIDTPFTDVNDDEGIVIDAKYAKSLGFSGKASISPRHVNAINTVFSPTQDEVDYAYEVLEAIEQAKAQGKGAISLYGKMIDAPIVMRAERVIASAKAIGIAK